MEELIEVLQDIDEEDVQIRVPRTRGPTRIRTRIQHFQKWNDEEFFDRFRMSKGTANVILDLIGERILTKTLRNRAVSPESKFLWTLRFYASGSFLVNVGGLSGLHKSTTSKIVKEVSTALALLCRDFIKIPTSEEDINEVKSGFYRKARFPNCIGAVDCTHVKIQSPGGNNAELYRNRKGVFTVNVQSVCDASLEIRNITARWPGSTHDSHIFNSSRIKEEIENNVYGNGVLVGDSGYACTNYLITPLEHVTTAEEQLFQESQVRTRNPAERCFGVWKRRFPVLALGIRLNIDRVERVVVATAVLNNICLKEKEDVPPVTAEMDAAIALLETPQEQPRPGTRNGHGPNTIIRYNLINRYFKRLL